MLKQDQTSHYNEQLIRQSDLQFNVPIITGAEAVIEAIAAKKLEGKVIVGSLQEIHGEN